MTIQYQEKNLFFNTYSRFPIKIIRGEGVYLYDDRGYRYLDMFAGLAVNALGYSHPKILQAIHDQSNKYIHISNFFIQETQIRLAEILLEASGYNKIFFCNSGTEGIEGAIKIARKWGKKNGKNNIISLSNSYHGRTLGSLSLMDREKYRDGYGPFLSNCTIVKFNDVSDLKTSVSDSTCAIFLEFIQGESGIIPVEEYFIRELEKLRNKFNFLIVADEIQTGLGRTGKLFSYEHCSLKPDIVVVAKALGGGFPLGAILGNDKVADIFQPGTHGSTFGGNPVACAAGKVVLDELLNNNLIENAKSSGEFLYTQLCDLKNLFPNIIKDVRGKGLMIGVEFFNDCLQIRNALLENKIIVNCTAGNVLRLLPPLIISSQQITEFISTLKKILELNPPR